MATNHFKKSRKTKSLPPQDRNLFDEARKDMKLLNSSGKSNAFMALIHVYQHYA